MFDFWVPDLSSTRLLDWGRAFRKDVETPSQASRGRDRIR
jgi:hypothetical protein